MRTNSRMRDLIARMPGPERDPGMPDGAQAILEDGWTLGPSGELLLRALWLDDWNDFRVSPSEIGQHEYEINDVAIPLEDLADDMSTYLPLAARRGFRFATRLLADAADLPGSDSLLAAVHVFVDEENELFLIQDTTVRFCTRRGNFPDWFDDLERFQLEAIAVLDQ